MDLRIQRTRQNIINAFIQLRAQKDLEKISVKELSELAFINKATFYKHYKDIYDLSEQLENELMESVFNELQQPEELLTNTKSAFKELCEIMIRQSSLFDIVFAGNRHDRMIDLLEEKLVNIICGPITNEQKKHETTLLLGVLIQGTFRTALKYRYDNFEKALDILGTINEEIMQRHRPE